MPPLPLLVGPALVVVGLLVLLVVMARRRPSTAGHRARSADPEARASLPAEPAGAVEPVVIDVEPVLVVGPDPDVTSHAAETVTADTEADTDARQTRELPVPAERSWEGPVAAAPPMPPPAPTPIELGAIPPRPDLDAPADPPANQVGSPTAVSWTDGWDDLQLVPRAPAPTGTEEVAPVLLPLPVPEADPEPASVATVPDTHPTGHPPAAPGYAEMSRALAASGRIREAALAQWAADLRALAPLLQDRVAALSRALLTLVPDDPAATVAGARAAALRLTDPGDDLPVLDDLAHLAPRLSVAADPLDTPRPLAGAASPEELAALESVLLTSAETGGDGAQVSVSLRCDLVLHLTSGVDHEGVGAVLREVLEPHERAAFDDELAARAS